MKLTSLFAVVANVAFASLMAGCLVIPDVGEDIEITDDECLNACNEQRDACDADYLDCEALCDANYDRGCDELYVEAMDARRKCDRWVAEASADDERDAWGE